MARNPNFQIDSKTMDMACKFNKEKEEVIGISKERLANTLIDIPKMKAIGLE
jgi:hypothetical protein